MQKISHYYNIYTEINRETIYSKEIIRCRPHSWLGHSAGSMVTEDPNDNYPDIIIKDEHKRLVFSMEITRRRSIRAGRVAVIRFSFPDKS